MSLIPVKHPVRLKSAAEAEAFFRALHVFTTPRIAVRGLHTTDVKRIVRILAALDPRRTHDLNFEGGVLGTSARAALTRLANIRKYEFLSLVTHVADLSIWPTLYTRIRSEKLFPRTFPDAEVKATPVGQDLETKSIPTALYCFFDVADERVKHGCINELEEAAKGPLLDFLRELGTTVFGVFVVDISSARELTELYDGERLDWTADRITVQFPEGTIESYMTSPNTTDDHRAKILKRIDKVLARAGIRHS